MKIMLANFTKMVNDSGGLAKVTSNFANEMNRRGHSVTVVYSDDNVGDFFYPLNKGIEVYDLRHMDGRSIDFPLWLKVKREIMRPVNIRSARTVNNEFAEQYLLENVRKVYERIKPDVIVAFQTAATKLLVCDLDIQVPVVSMSHGDPEDYFHTYAPNELPALSKCAMCQVLLPSFEQHLKNHVPEAKTITIGNVVPQYEELADLAAEKQTYRIVQVGRMVRNHKRPHLLIKAFALLARDFPEWTVEIWGAEDKKVYTKQLKRLIKSNGLEKQVFLKGTTSNVPSKLRQADIFAFPSAYEGFPLAMTEAMSMGLPVVGYNSCAAVNELVRDGENGILCEEGVEAFAEALSRMMKDKKMRIRFGKQAHEDMKAYSPDVIWHKWEELMKRLLEK